MIEIKNPTKKILSNSRFVFSCYYHVIFCPKYRRSILVDSVETDLKNIFLDVSQKYNFEIVELETMPDHVHMIISCDPSFGIVSCIARLKGVSASILRKKYQHLKKMPCLWTRSFFVSTVGTVSLETVKQYIRDQKGM